MDKYLQDEITLLVGKHGKEAVGQAAEMLLNFKRKPTTEYHEVLNPGVIKDTLWQLDASLNDLDEVSKKQQAVFGEKGPLLQRKRQLETEIQLAEAEAFMTIQGEGRSQFVVVDGKKISLTNDTMRDAYRRKMSGDLRKKLAEVEGELLKIETEQEKVKDEWFSKKEMVENVRAKAIVQGNLLKYLA